MSLVIKQIDKQFPIPSEGIYDAVIVDIVDLGKIDTPWGPKSKISIMWELSSEDPNGNRYIVGKRYTKSLNEKAHLRQDIEALRTQKFKPQELKNGFDLEKLLDVSCKVFISHNETDKRTYANIQSVMPPENGDDGNPKWFNTRPSGDYTRVKNREGYQQPEDYEPSTNGDS